MPDESGSLVQLPGSERASLPDVTDAAPLDTSQRAEVTLVLRRRAELPEEIVTGPTVLSLDQLAGYGADPADVDLVRTELEQRGLTVTDVQAVTRRVKVAGTLGDLSSAFGTTLWQVSSPDPSGRGRVTHRYREGPLYVPALLADVVTAVLGLDTRPQAQPHFRVRSDAAAAAQSTSYNPNQVAAIYDFPENTTGTGQTIAVIELGGGFTTSDLDAYFGGLGIAVPSVTAASVDGASNNPGDTSGADGEVNLDIDVIGAIAPGAAQVVYFAPNNGDQGFVDAISNAVQASPAPIAISISWGQSEDSWTAQGLASMNSAMSDAAALGITVCVAAGDNGSSDGVSDGQVHVDFPASSPYALACGGTTLVANPTTDAISSEVVWNELPSNEGATGGGVSDQFALPSWQASAGVPARAASQPGSAAASAAGAAGAAVPAGSAVGGDAEDEYHRRHHRFGEHRRKHHPTGGTGGTGGGSGGGTGGSGGSGGTGGSGGSGGSSGVGGRGVPDVAGNADPVTGYNIYYGGQAQVVGGTSAVAPLWSALIARLAQATGQRFGLIQTPLYAGVSAGTDVAGFRDITSGNNGAYSAGPGWDACSGLGSPNGTELLSRLQSS